MAKVMDDGLKQRLIGAVVLLAIAVIFIPVLFDRNTITPVDTTSQVPPMPQIAIEPIPVAEPPVVASPAPAPEAMLIPDEVVDIELAAQVQDDSAEVVEQLANETDKPEQVQTIATTVEEEPKKVTKQEVPSAPSLNSVGVPNGWLLQVISYTEEPKANAFRDQLIAKGYPAFVRKASINKGLHYRVFIGPKLDRAEVLKMKAEVDKKFHLNTWVVNMTPGT